MVPFTLVVVLEDLQWADEGLLDFVDELAARLRDAPLLLLCTARPELLERRPGWGGGKPNALTISLAPLADEETERLASSVLGQPLLDAELQEALLARTGGNPLYIEQFARMFAEVGTHERLPETVHGIIAARLDGLLPQEKALLEDAAVVGKIFWSGAIESLGAVTRGQRKSCSSRSSARSLCSRSVAPRLRATPSTPSATSCCATSPTRRSRAPLVPTSTAGQLDGSSRWAARMITPRCLPTTTRALRHTRERRGEKTWA